MTAAALRTFKRMYFSEYYYFAGGEHSVYYYYYYAFYTLSLVAGRSFVLFMLTEHVFFIPLFLR